MQIRPDRQTINQGTSAELRCIVTGGPSLDVSWSKVPLPLYVVLTISVYCINTIYLIGNTEYLLIIVYPNHRFLLENIDLMYHTLISFHQVNEEFGSGVSIDGNILRINNAVVSDRGMYVCTAKNEGGIAQAAAIVEVERKYQYLSH